MASALKYPFTEGVSGDGFAVAWEVDAPYDVRHISSVGDELLVAMRVSPHEGALMYVDPQSGRTRALRSGLPRIDRIRALGNDWAIAAFRPRADQPTDIHLLDGQLRVAATHTFEAAVNDFTCLSWGAVVGTRDGWVRAFAPDGEPLWTWDLPAALDNKQYAAWNVVSGGEVVLISVMDTVYALGCDGILAWVWRTQVTHDPNEREVSPADVRDGTDDSPGLFDDVIEELREARRELRANRDDDELELFDELPDDDAPRPSGLGKYARVGNPYMRWSSKDGFMTGGPAKNTIQALVADNDQVAVGDSQSRLHFLALPDGSTRQSVDLHAEDRQVRLIADSDHTVRGALCTAMGVSQLVLLDGADIIGTAVIDEHHYAGVAIGHGVLSYTGSDLRGFDPSGRQRWRAEQTSVSRGTPFGAVAVFHRKRGRLVAIKSEIS